MKSFIIVALFFILSCSTTPQEQVEWVPAPSYIQLTDGRFVVVTTEEEFYAIPEELRGDRKYFQFHRPVSKN